MNQTDTSESRIRWRSRRSNQNVTASVECHLPCCQISARAEEWLSTGCDRKIWCTINLDLRVIEETTLEGKENETFKCLFNILRGIQKRERNKYSTRKIKYSQQTFSCHGKVFLSYYGFAAELFSLSWVYREPSAHNHVKMSQHNVCTSARVFGEHFMTATWCTSNLVPHTVCKNADGAYVNFNEILWQTLWVDCRFMNIIGSIYTLHRGYRIRYYEIFDFPTHLQLRPVFCCKQSAANPHDFHPHTNIYGCRTSESLHVFHKVFAFDWLHTGREKVN